MARWQKSVWNIAFNGLSVVLDSKTDQMLSNLPTRQLVNDMMLEVISAARAVGADVKDSHADKMINMTLDMIPYHPSMKLDYDIGRPMEIEYMKESYKNMSIQR